MTLQDIKETKRYGRTHRRTDACTDGQCENSIPTTNKVCGGYKNNLRIISKPQEHLKTVTKTHVKFQKNWHKTVGGVAHTRYLLVLLSAGRRMERKMNNTESHSFSSKRRAGIFA